MMIPKKQSRTDGSGQIFCWKDPEKISGRLQAPPPHLQYPKKLRAPPGGCMWGGVLEGKKNWKLTVQVCKGVVRLEAWVGLGMVGVCKDKADARS